MDNRFICPCCGAVCVVGREEEGARRKRGGLFSRLFGGGDEFEASRRWQPTLTQPVAEPRPIAPPFERPHVLARYFDLNWRHALVSGFLAGLCAFLFFMPPVLNGHGKLYRPVTWGLGTFAVVSAIVWGILLFSDRKGLNKLEMALGIDLNRDGSIGGAVEEPKTTVVDFTDHDKRQRFIVELPIRYEVMRQIAQTMLRSQGQYSFSRRDMMAKTSISDEEFRELQRIFIEKGWAHYRSEGKPNSGVELLAAGRAVLRQYL